MNRRLAAFAAAAAALAGCATSGWSRMQEEFAQVQGNCRLHGTRLERDRSDKRLLRLVFLHRNNMAAQAQEDGRFACAAAWARENGYRMTLPETAAD